MAPTDEKTALPPQAPAPEEDYDRVDYSRAFHRENQRRLRSEEIIKGHENAELIHRDRLMAGFPDASEYKDFGTSNGEVLFDVLPSFEMYRSIHMSSNGDTASADPLADLPPVYTNEPVEACPTRVMNMPRPALSVSESSSSHRSSIATGSSNSTTFNPPSLSDPDTAVGYSGEGELDRNVTDNTHKLPRLRQNPLVTVEVHVTKNVPRPHTKPEEESTLKEYTSGDVVHGYVIINNGSTEPLPFQMFYVTLEGTIAIADKKDGKLYSRKFLSMVDLAASWSYGCIQPSANMLFTKFGEDYDGTIMGLPDDRIIAPKTKHKKFFTFKMPYSLLDNTCRHGQELHTLPPPSFGLNRFAHGGKYRNITVDKTLHFGHNGHRGSPVLVNDSADDKLSVNYGINATLVVLQRTEKSDVPKLAVLAEHEYSLRFIPFGFNVSLFSSKDALKRLQGSVVSSIKTASRGLLLEEDGQEEAVAELDSEIKLQQLALGHDNESVDASSFPLRNQKDATPDWSKVETSLSYVSQKKLLFGKKSPQGLESGVVKITTGVPKDGLPYIAPPLIQKVNKIDTLAPLHLANYDLMSKALTTNEKQTLTGLEFDLSFLPSDMGLQSSSKPPEISQIVSSLMLFNVYSKSSIPVKLSSDLFLGEGEKFYELKSQFTKYEEELQKLEKQFEERKLDIRKFVDKSIFEDVRAMKGLQVDQCTHQIFKNKFNTQKTTDWVKTPEGLWSKKVSLDLEFHDNISQTLIPNFQSCLMSRIYCILVEFKFKNCDKTASVRVPIRLRWFE